MTGKSEIDRQRKRLDAAFDRASGAAKAGADAELLSDLARHLCVLVAGFLEQAVIEIALEHVRTHSHVSIQRYAEGRLRRFTSANAKNVIELLGSFDPDWKTDLEAYLVDQYKDAVNGVVDLRHTVAHGRFAGVTIVSIRSYYERVKHVVDHCIQLCIP
jgi:RiboL-PSP-HEPN